MKIVRNRTILIADDSAENLKVLKGMLSEYGHSLRFARDGQQVVDIIKNELVDLILLDINMPIKDGFEACKEIKNDERTRHIPIIFLTALSDKKYVLKGLSIGGTDYVTKPFSHDELILRVNTQLDLVVAREEKKFFELEILKKEEASKRIKANLDLLSNLISGLMHEVNNPLTISLNMLKVIDLNVKEFIDLLEKKHNLALKENNQTEDIFKSIESCSRNTWRIHDLVVRLKEFELPVKKEETDIDLAQCIADCFGYARSNTFENSEIELTFNLENDPITISSDKNILQKLFKIVLLNSIEAIQEKITDQNPKGEITVSLKKDNDNNIHITIFDNGIGFPKDIQEKIFLPFFTTKYAMKSVGLGLTIASNIVVNYFSGKIQVDSEPGAFTQVKIVIPPSRD